jgi:hypothetical protein
MTDVSEEYIAYFIKVKNESLPAVGGKAEQMLRACKFQS